MRGIDLLAAGCQPETPDPSPEQSTIINFNDEQLSKIADLVIQRLQQPAAPKPQEAPETPDPEPSDPEPETTGGEADES